MIAGYSLGLTFHPAPYILYEMDVTFTPEMCRAGRALLGMSQEELARRAGVARLTVADFERGARKPIAATLAATRSALATAGVDFVPGGAVLRGVAAPAGEDGRLAAILRVLQGSAARLRRLGVLHLSLFGSTARGSAGPGSDIDLLVELDSRRKIDLLDYAGIVGEIQQLLPQPVDVARRDRLKPHVTEGALRDAIRVF
jgi:predicted nucleotidyltransferase/DNA-binding XRE family transcriptional regulator